MRKAQPPNKAHVKPLKTPGTRRVPGAAPFARRRAPGLVADFTWWPRPQGTGPEGI